MKRLTIRKQVTVFVACVAVATALFFLGFLVDRSSTAMHLLHRVLSIMAPFIVGGIIAFILKPLCNLLDIPIGNFLIKKVYHRRLAAGTTTERRVRKTADRVSIAIAMLAFFLILAGLISAVMPQLIDSVRTIINSIPSWLESFSAWLTRTVGDDNAELAESINEQITKMTTEFSTFLADTVIPQLQNLTAGDLSNIFSILSGTVNVTRTIINVLLNVVISLVVIAYTLANRKKFARQGTLIIYAIFPKKWADLIIKEFKYANGVFSGFISGRMLDSFLVGLLIFILCNIFGIPQAILVALLMGASQMIPFFGPYIGAVPSCLIILMIDPIKMLYFLILMVVIQQLDANILDPLIVGNSIEMSSFWILFSVILFGGLFGFAGLLIGVPTFTILYDIIRQLTDFGLKKRGEEKLYESYMTVFHDPSDDPDLLREKARNNRRAKRHTREEEKRIKEFVAEAQSSGTTEAAMPILSVDEVSEPEPEEIAAEATEETTETKETAESGTGSEESATAPYEEEAAGTTTEAITEDATDGDNA